MGFFSGIKKFIKKGYSPKTKSIIKTYKEKGLKATLKQEVIKFGIGAGIAGAAFGAALNPVAAGAIAKAAIPKTLAGKAIAAVTVPIAATAFFTSRRTRKAVGRTIEKAPSAVVTMGTNIGEFVETPSVEKFKDIIKESPVLTGVIAGGAALMAAPLIIPAASGILTRSEMEKQTAAFERQAKAAEERGSLPLLSAGTGSLVAEKQVSTDEGIPVSTPTQTVTTGRKKRKRKKKAPSSIKQSVKIDISNRNINRKVYKHTYIG